MPRQTMKIRDKRHFGPSARYVAPQRKINLASTRGASAWDKGKSILDNPYAPGLEHDAWRKSYLQASKFKHNPVHVGAPEGYAPHKDGYVIIKRNGSTKRLPAKQDPVDIFKNSKELEIYQKQHLYTGYTKPGKDGRVRRFFPWTSNPREDKWRNKQAYKTKPREE